MIDHRILFQAERQEDLSAVLSKSNKQSLWSCEAENQGLALAVQEAIFLRGCLRELEYENCEPTTIGEDNQSCVNLATNRVFHQQPNHNDAKQPRTSVWQLNQIELRCNRWNGSKSSDKISVTAEKRTTSRTTIGQFQMFTERKQSEWGFCSPGKNFENILELGNIIYVNELRKETNLPDS